MRGDPRVIINSVEVTSTDTIKSLVTARHNSLPVYHGHTTIEKTNTGTGALILEVNDEDEKTYNEDVLAQSGATYADKEAAKTDGWVQQEFNEAASITIAADNPDTHTHEIEIAAKRFRYSYTNATGTVTLTVRTA